MNFSKILYNGLATTCLLMNLQATASSSKSSSESSVSSADDKIMRAVARHTRRKIKLKQLDRLLNCATTLVEYQFNGPESSMRGLEFMNEASIRIMNENYQYKDLKRSCKKQLKEYRKERRKKTCTEGLMLTAQSKDYLKDVKNRFRMNPNMIKIAKKALNSNLDCHKATGWDLKIGIIGSISFGWDHYTCKTSLGRRYHITGPNMGIGMGIGITLDTNVADRTHFSLPHNSKWNRILRDDSRSMAAIFGKGKTSHNQGEKSSDLTVGLGLHTTERAHLMVKIRSKPDFNRSGLYRYLGVPKEINNQ